MSFSTKLISDYSFLANDHLDKFPVEKVGDFIIISEALKTIIEPNCNHSVPMQLKDRVLALQALIDSPEEYVVSPENYNEFKKIIVTRIAAKINELQNLTDSEKQKYLVDQKELKEKTLQNQTKIVNHTEPKEGSEARTISEAQMLQEMQTSQSILFDPQQLQNLSQQVANLNRMAEDLRDRGNSSNFTDINLLDLSNQINSLVHQ